MKKTLIFAATALAISSCASHLEKRIEEKLALESADQPQSAATDALLNKASLSEDQKQELKILRNETSEKLKSLHDQSLKLRSILVKDILDKNYDQQEVNAIKSRLKQIENKRLTTLFDAVDKANLILGRQAENHHAMLSEFMEIDKERF